MPATSKAQFRFMQGVAHGSIDAPGLSEAKAAEYVQGQSPKNLPERAAARETVRRHNSRQPKHRQANEDKATALLEHFRKSKKQKEY